MPGLDDEVIGRVITNLAQVATDVGTRDAEVDALVGQLRRLWKGFDGGAEARQALEEFFAGVRARAVVHQ